MMILTNETMPHQKKYEILDLSSYENLIHPMPTIFLFLIIVLGLNVADLTLCMRADFFSVLFKHFHKKNPQLYKSA